MKECKRIFISTAGDPSVGLYGFDAEISCAGNFLFHEDWEAEHIEEFRDQLSAAFTELWDEKAHVQFDYETEANEDGT